MEEKIVVEMEVDHATHREGKAKPSSRWVYGAATCIAR